MLNLQRPSFLIALGVALFLALNIIGERLLRPVMLDLTEAGLYSLSDGTRSIVGELAEPVTLDLYFSKSLAAPYPGILAYGKRVEDFLRTVSRIESDKLTLRVIDPEPFSEAEDEAVAAGLTGVPLPDGTTLYLGLSAQNSLDGEALIPFFSEDREAFLEYDIAKLIQSLDLAAKPKLTLLTQLPMAFGEGGPQAAFSGASAPFVLYEQLGEFFDLSEITADFQSIPAETDVLMLVHPPELSDDQLYAIDQYVLNGGRLIAFLDPHAESMSPRTGFEPSASTLGPLLSAWGLEMPAGQVVGDGALAQRVSFGGYGPDAVKDYVLWLGINQTFMAEGEVALSSVETINMASAGVLTPLETDLKIDPLLTTSASSMLYNASRAAGRPDADALLRDLAPDGRTHILAARVSGRAKTAFPDRVAATSLPDLGTSEGDIQVVVLSDADIVADRYWVQVQDVFGSRIAVPIAGNGSFILNLADQMTGSDALLSLRGRGISRRPFTVVDDLRKAAEARYLAEEQRLNAELAEAEARLAELEGTAADSTLLSPEQEAEVERFRANMLETRKALREVQRGLRSDIDALGDVLAAINIFGVAGLVVLFGLVRRYGRRRRAQAQGDLV